MARSFPPVQWLRTFEAAARHRNFSKAAGELGLTPAAVSHQIRTLEAELGFPLFDRLGRRVELTEIGHAYLPSVARALDDLMVATVGLFGTEREAHVTLRAPVTLIDAWIAGRLPHFAAAHPGIRLRLLAGSWAGPDGSADLDIQFGTGTWPGYEATLLLRAPSRMVVQAGSVVPPIRGPAMIAALIKDGVVQIMGCESRWIRLAREYGLPEEAIRVNATTDNSGSALQLTRAGLGPCLVQDYYARPAVDLGGLTLLPGVEVAIDEAQYILLPHAPRRKNPATMLVRKWLLDEVSVVRGR